MKVSFALHIWFFAQCAALVVDALEISGKPVKPGPTDLPLRFKLPYDAMHIHGKPFVSCNHPAFKFGCAQMTFPRPYMTVNNRRLLNGASIDKVGEPMEKAPKRSAFLEFALKQGWSVKESAYRGKPLGYRGPGQA